LNPLLKAAEPARVARSAGWDDGLPIEKQRTVPQLKSLSPEVEVALKPFGDHVLLSVRRILAERAGLTDLGQSYSLCG